MAFAYHKAMDIQRGHINTLRGVIAVVSLVLFVGISLARLFR